MDFSIDLSPFSSCNFNDGEEQLLGVFNNLNLSRICIIDCLLVHSPLMIFSSD
ncbi:unnamed protein product [Schistosoma mattheei]|uniref:Uncharacterized protein n=1 Tax=Schistosoma mattheei TaxID=31246 RepID=A0A183NW63_9TREM|nr:unnamed protein product [Schistosoma mattheei]